MSTASHERTSLPFTDFSARHSTHLSLRTGVNTCQPKAVRPRVAGARSREQTAPGIAAAGLPPSMDRGLKKTRNNASAWAGYHCSGFLRLRCPCCRSLLLADRFCGCREEKYAVSWRTCDSGRMRPSRTTILRTSMSTAPHGRTSRHACRLRGSCARHSSHLSVNARQGFEAPVGGADNCNRTASGIAVDRTPAVEDRGQKKIRNNASAWTGYRHSGYPVLLLQIASACQQVLWKNRASEASVMTSLDCACG